MRLIRKLHVPGTAPGTVADTPSPAEPVRLTVMKYDLDDLSEAELSSVDQLHEPTPGTVTWLDVEGQDSAVISAIGERLGLHPLVTEDLINLGQRPKVEEFVGCLFMIVEHICRNHESGDLEHEQVSIVVTSDAVLSVREARDPLFDPVRKRLHGGRPRIRGGGPGYLAYALIDTVVDHLFVVLGDMGESIEELEDRMVGEPTRENLVSLHELKREILMMRKSVWPMRDMIGQIIRDESDLISDETRLYLRDVADHASRALDIVETYREMISSLVDLYLSSVSNRMNEVMKVLTIIATIFIPLSFIAGLYGMNFDTEASPFNLPELSWYYGYPLALLVMLAVATGLLGFFRRKGWI